ncbi:MAG: hypothetical protein H6560_04575 [Lewinellaceae bacterium]|nr:hypothetical protein [Lewinellaceae bacterium]
MAKKLIPGSKNKKALPSPPGARNRHPVRIRKAGGYLFEFLMLFLAVGYQPKVGYY